MLKMSTEHQNRVAACIAPLNTDENRAAYREGRFPRAELCKDVDKRFRWDLLHAGQHTDRELLTDIYAAGCNDVNIDSVLRGLVAAL